MAKARKTKTRGKAGGKKPTPKAKPQPKRAAKPAAKAKPKKAAPKAKVVVRPKPPASRAARTPTKTPTRAPVRASIPPPPPPAPAPAPVPPLDPALRAEVAAALERNGYESPEPGVVDVLTTVAAGYRKGPADAPPAMAAHADKAVADAVVDLYTLGDLAPVVGRRMARPAVRATVDSDLRQFGPNETGDEEREVLMGLCLGLWDPDRDTFAQRDGVAGFVGRWYRAGLA